MQPSPDICPVCHLEGCPAVASGTRQPVGVRANGATLWHLHIVLDLAITDLTPGRAEGRLHSVAVCSCPDNVPLSGQRDVQIRVPPGFTREMCEVGRDWWVAHRHLMEPEGAES